MLISQHELYLGDPPSVINTVAAGPSTDRIVINLLNQFLNFK